MAINFDKALVVKTSSGAEYHLGPADEAGERDIHKESGKPLPFSRGKLAGSGNVHILGGEILHTEPVEGEQLALEPTNGDFPEGDIWFATIILSIEQG